MENKKSDDQNGEGNTENPEKSAVLHLPYPGAMGIIGGGARSERRGEMARVLLPSSSVN